VLIRTVNKTIFNNFLFLLLLLLQLQLLPNSNVANIFVSVFVSVIANGIVIFVMSFRRKKIRTIHILFLFMAISDILFSLAIHSMLIATSLGSNPVPLFGKVGKFLFFCFHVAFWEVQNTAKRIWGCRIKLFIVKTFQQIENNYHLHCAAFQPLSEALHICTWSLRIFSFSNWNLYISCSIFLLIYKTTHSF